MPKSKGAKKAMKKFKDQYGDEGEQVYYATANKQDRDPDTFKKESVRLVNDLVVEQDGGMVIVPKGTYLAETVGTGAIAIVPSALGDQEEEDDEEVEEASNSQLSDLQQDH